MSKQLNKYLINSFFSSFNQIFMSLFFMTSIVFFIKISSMTSIIQVTFIELLELYILLLPKIFLYTLPVSFFVGLALSIYKLSNENETLVMFTLGLSSKSFSKVFFKISLLFSALLMVNNLYLMPLSKELYNTFIHTKKLEAKLNIKETEFGQKFASWLVFVNKNEDGLYKDIVMFDTTKNEEKLITAKNAELINNISDMSILLKQGNIFINGKDKQRQVNFESMKMGSEGYISTGYRHMDLKQYFNNMIYDKSTSTKISFYILMALLPILSYLFCISIGIINFRYEKGNIYIYMFSFILIYFVLTEFLTKSIQLWSLGPIIFVTFVFSYFIFNKMIKTKY